MGRVELTNLTDGTSSPHKKGFIGNNNLEISENSKYYDLFIGHSYQDKENIKKLKKID